MRMTRILTLALAAIGLSGAGIPAAAAQVQTQTHAQTQVQAAVQPAAACTGTAALTQLGFVPSSVAPGQNSNLKGTLANCTSQPVAITLLITWQLLGTAQNCFVNDPTYMQETLPANGTLSLGGQYMVAGTCTASGVQATVKITDAGNNVLAQGTAVLAIEQPMPVLACHVTYTVQSQWQGGFGAAISISNTGEVGFGNWTLTFTFGGDQKLTTVWGATGTQNGAIATLKNVSYDASIAPGQTISGIGFNGTFTNSNAAPTGFNLNGTLCS